MSAVAAVVHGESVILVADRTAVVPGSWLMAGVPRPAEERDKLFVVEATGVALAVAGVCVSSSGVDLLAQARRVCAAESSAARAAAAVFDLCDQVADEFRSDQVPLETVPLFEAPVVTVALVAGAGRSGQSAFAVGLTAQGPPIQVSVPAPGVAYGPPDARAELDLAVIAAASEPDVATAAGLVGASVVNAATSYPGFVSADWDAALVSDHGSQVLLWHRQQGPKVPYGA